MLIERKTALDDRGEIGAGDALQVHVRIGGAHGPLVSAARHGRGRREQANAPGPASGHGQLRRRRHHADHVDRPLALGHIPLQCIQRGRARRVTRHHQQLGPGLEEVVGDLDRERSELLLAARTVGKARRVPEVEVVLVGQRYQQFVQDGQAADSGIEDGHRLLCRWGGHASMVPERRADTLASVRALIVTAMYPTPEHPALGSFVRDQVEALRRIDGIDVEVFPYPGGDLSAYAKAARDLRGRFDRHRFDVVHAHFGLSAWPSLMVRAPVHAVTLHGTDLAHPRSRAITLSSLRLLDLVAVVSEPLRASVPRWASKRPPAVLPCGVNLKRFRPLPRAEARQSLGLASERPYLLFPAAPARPEKRFDRAQAVAGDVQLLTLGDVPPERVPLLINAANAVLVTSEREGFGLAVLEALACDVPVLATDVGIAPKVLNGVAGAFCGPFEAEIWREALKPHLDDRDPRIHGRAHAEPFSADRLAADVAEAWQRALTAKAR